MEPPRPSEIEKAEIRGAIDYFSWQLELLTELFQ
jgi:hypothetical protein